MKKLNTKPGFLKKAFSDLNYVESPKYNISIEIYDEVDKDLLQELNVILFDYVNTINEKLNEYHDNYKILVTQFLVDMSLHVNGLDTERFKRENPDLD